MLYLKGTLKLKKIKALIPHVDLKSNYLLMFQMN